MPLRWMAKSMERLRMGAHHFRLGQEILGAGFHRAEPDLAVILAGQDQDRRVMDGDERLCAPYRAPCESGRCRSRSTTSGRKTARISMHFAQRAGAAEFW